MPFTRPTLAELIETTITDIQTRLPGADAGLRNSNLNVLARVQAGGEHGLYGFDDWISRQILPDTAESEILDRQASIWGIARTAATYAQGDVTLTGTNNLIVPAGTRLQRGDGVEYATLAEATIDAGTATVGVTAVLAGAAGDATAGTAISLVSPIAGVTTAAVVAAGGLTGGADAETDASLRVRVIARIQQAPHGGARFDYEAWALAEAGVTRVWVYPQELGLGTVTVRFMMDDTYDDGIPLAADVDSVQAALDPVRPVTADLTVVAPLAAPIGFEISGLDPVSLAVKDAIEAELKDLIRREAEPGSTLLISHISEAISIAAGEIDHALVSPAANVVSATGDISTFGTITWS